MRLCYLPNMKLEPSVYAHSLPGAGVERWQTLEAHADGVAARAEGFAAPFHSGEVARLLGLAHDLGKRKAAFQEHLRNPLVRCSHAYDGAKWLAAHLGDVGTLLAYAVAGHHTGLPDWSGDATGLESHLGETPTPEVPKGLPLKVPEGWGWLPPFLRQGNDLHKAHLWVRMLFSALVDADWLDTEAFMSPGRAALRPTAFDGMATLLGRYERTMAAFAERPRTPLNVLRAEVLGEVLAAAERPRGLFSLTVPTGGGKTLASLGFALRHARRHGLRKILYVAPYSTIIEQTVDVLGRVLGEGNVLDHYAEARWRAEEGAETTALQLATENWAGFPVVVTTNVQFFESFYAAQTSRCGSCTMWPTVSLCWMRRMRCPGVWWRRARICCASCALIMGALWCCARQRNRIFRRLGFRRRRSLCVTRSGCMNGCGGWIMWSLGRWRRGRRWRGMSPDGLPRFAWSI